MNEDVWYETRYRLRRGKRRDAGLYSTSDFAVSLDEALSYAADAAIEAVGEIEIVRCEVVKRIAPEEKTT